MVFYLLILLGITLSLFSFGASGGEQPLSRIAIHRTTFAVHSSAYVKASPSVLGLKGENKEWVTLNFGHPNPSSDDWIGVFSPANFSASVCALENERVYPPTLCTSPVKFQYANYKDNRYNKTGKGSLKLQLINQREDFSFALFSGGFLKPKLVAVSNTVTFAYPKAPVYPRLAQGNSWNEVRITVPFPVAKIYSSELVIKQIARLTLKTQLHGSFLNGHLSIHVLKCSLVSLFYLQIMSLVMNSTLIYYNVWDRKYAPGIVSMKKIPDGTSKHKYHIFYRGFFNS